MGLTERGNVCVKAAVESPAPRSICVSSSASIDASTRFHRSERKRPSAVGKGCHHPLVLYVICALSIEPVCVVASEHRQPASERNCSVLGCNKRGPPKHPYQSVRQRTPTDTALRFAGAAHVPSRDALQFFSRTRLCPINKESVPDTRISFESPSLSVGEKV